MVKMTGKLSNGGKLGQYFDSSKNVVRGGSK